MRLSKLFGVLLIVIGMFVFTRGTAWHFTYMASGSLLGIVGFLFVLRQRREPFRVKLPRRRVEPRAGRVRAATVSGGK